MAMDLFYNSLKDGGLRTERYHFHEFLKDIHVELHRMRLEEMDADKSTIHRMERCATRIAGRVDVLCFDEFAITTIQDCTMILPLFSVLFRCGVVVVTTSNRAPEDLYTDGLNRYVYIPPFLKILHEHCKVHQLVSDTDYRIVHCENSPDANVYCWPADPTFLDKWFAEISGPGGTVPGRLELAYGRSIGGMPLSRCGRTARFSFSDLCRGNLGADDYNALCKQLHTVIVDDVPILTVDNHNEARRFTNLIDCCYEHHVRLIMTMAGSPREVMGGLSDLREMTLTSLGGGGHGCGDGDTSPSSSGVLQAINRIKESMAEKVVANNTTTGTTSVRGDEKGTSSRSILRSGSDVSQVLGAEIARVKAHGDDDVAVWRQGGGDGKNGQGSSTGSVSGPLQVSKSWDDRRRISAFTWESADPTQEQQAIKGVFSAAIASLQETGFAIERAVSRLKEMQTVAFQDVHRIKHKL